MKIAVTVNGLDSLAGGYVLVALGFYQPDSIPSSLISLLNSIPSTYIYTPKIFSKIMSYANYFHYEYDLIKIYDNYVDFNSNLRNSAQRLALSINYKLLKYSSTKYIYSKHLPKPTDFNVTFANSNNDHLEFYIANIIAYHKRLNNLMLLEYQYPNYRFTEHKGNKTPKHFEEIIKYGITPYHRHDTLYLTAKYIQKYINVYHDEKMLKHQKLFKRLPNWWQIAEPSKVTLEDYFTEQELADINYHLGQCRKYKRFKYSERNIHFKPQKPIPSKFIKWLESN